MSDRLLLRDRGIEPRPLLHPSFGAFSLGVALAGARALVALWVRRARGRRELAALPPHLLRDVGLDESSARFEAGKPFWRA